MRLGYNMAYLVGDVAHHHSWLSCYAYNVNAVSAVVYLLNERQRHKHRLLVVAIDIHVSVRIVYTHHTEVNRVDTDYISTRVASLRKQTLIHLFAYYTHLSPLIDVHLIDVSTIHHLGFANLLHFGQHTFDDARCRTVVVSGIGTPP